ncbi:hypothetical protein DFH28DRAFT_893346 [Melampsora americana]|nr:hypothetical protein DFH28DRAFT_893346 [Melampsora americana]
MIPNLYLINITFMILASSTRMSCFTSDTSLELGHTSSTLKVNDSPEIIKVHASTQRTNHLQDKTDTEPQCSASPMFQQQKDFKLTEVSHNSMEIDRSKGKKRVNLIDLNIPYEVSLTPEANHPRKHPKIGNQVQDGHLSEILNHPSSNSVQEAPKSVFMKDSRSLSKKIQGREKMIQNDSDARLGTSHSNSIPTSSSSDSMIIRQNEVTAQIGSRMYRFKLTGESALLSDYRVIRIGNRWHVVPQCQVFVDLMKEHGLEIATKQGLYQAGKKLNPWFKSLERDMQNKLIDEIGSEHGSKEIHLAIIKAYKHLTMEFLSSLWMIHAQSSEDMNELTNDAWNFIKGFFSSWREVNWKDSLVIVPTINLSHCQETYTSFQILSYLMKNPTSSRISICLFWSLCNSWYKSSTYQNKKEVKSLEEFVNKTHQYLARLNLLPEWEVEPYKAHITSHLEDSIMEKNKEIINQGYRPSREEVRRENTFLKSNNSRRALSMIKEVGNDILHKLKNKGLSLNFIDHYCDRIKQQDVRWPHNWGGDFDTLKQRMKIEIFPGFLGMVELLHPLQTNKAQKETIAINGFDCLKDLLKSWGENSLKNASQIDSQSFTNFDPKNDFSSALLAYLLRLKSNSRTYSAPSVFWELWKVWEKWEGSDFLPKLYIKSQPEFMAAIRKSYSMRK